MGGQGRAEGVRVTGVGSGAGRVEGDIGDAGLGRNRVVPLPVEVVGADDEGGGMLFADLDSGGVAAGVQTGGHSQPGAGGGRRDEELFSLFAGLSGPRSP